MVLSHGLAQIFVLGSSNVDVNQKRNVFQASLKGGNCDANVPYMRYRLTQDGTPVGSDVDFDKDEDHLYVIAGKKVG